MIKLICDRRNTELVKEGKEAFAPAQFGFLKQITVLEQEIKPKNFSMDSFMTTKKDKELSRVECSATAHYKYY